ncbi:hypothetical protein ACFLYB_03260 [Chloroflexota bacterium]
MKEKLPDWSTGLEGQVCRMSNQIPDLVAECYASLFMTILQQLECGKDKAKDEAIKEGNTCLKHKWSVDLVPKLF